MGEEMNQDAIGARIATFQIPYTVLKIKHAHGHTVTSKEFGPLDKIDRICDLVATLWPGCTIERVVRYEDDEVKR